MIFVIINIVQKTYTQISNFEMVKKEFYQIYFIIILLMQIMENQKIKSEINEKISYSQFETIPFVCKKIIYSEASPYQNKQREIKNYETYKKNIMSKQEVQYTQTNNILPINFSNSVTEYNKLLITNGKKYITTKQSIFEPQNIQSLNIPIYKKNIVNREELLTVQKQKDKKQKILENPTNCGCCCCDKYCNVCEHQHKVSRGASRRKSNSSLSFLRSKKSQKKMNIKKYQQQIINKSELKRQQKQQKQRKKILNIDPFLEQKNRQKYEKIKGLVNKSINLHLQQQKTKQQQSCRRQNQKRVAKMQMRNFGEMIRQKNLRQVHALTPQRKYHEFPWGANQDKLILWSSKKQQEQLEKRRNRSLQKTLRNYKSAKKYQQSQKKNKSSKKPVRIQNKKKHEVQKKLEKQCHQKSIMSRQQIVHYKKQHLLEALRQIKYLKQCENLKRASIQNNLHLLEVQRRKIIQKNKKKEFKRLPKQQQEKVFTFDIQTLRKLPESSDSLKKKRLLF